jgi:hypothetical protein
MLSIKKIQSFSETTDHTWRYFTHNCIISLSHNQLVVVHRPNVTIWHDIWGSRACSFSNQTYANPVIVCVRIAILSGFARTCTKLHPFACIRHSLDAYAAACKQHHTCTHLQGWFLCFLRGFYSVVHRILFPPSHRNRKVRATQQVYVFFWAVFCLFVGSILIIFD